MRKALLATASGAALLAAGPALAADMADKLTVGVGGYMQQWIGMSSLDGPDKDGEVADGGVSQYHDSEIFFKGSLEADNGLTFAVKVELEGNTHTDVVDESQLTVSGAFGQIVLGSEDDPATLMHYGNQDVGVGLNCGDAGFINGLTTCARATSIGLGTAGHLANGDTQKIAYYTPRMEGVQFGISYSPESIEDGPVGAPVNNDNEAVSLGLNYMGEMGGVNLALSAGYFQKSRTMEAVALMSGRAPGAGSAANYGRLTAKQFADYEKDIADYKAARDLERVRKETSIGDIAVHAATAVTAEDAILNAQDSMAFQTDDQTIANFGLQVGFGAFGFDVAYLVHDGGIYKPTDMPRRMTVQEAQRERDRLNTGRTSNLATVTSDGRIIDPANTGNFGGANATATTPESATNNDPSNEQWMVRQLAKDGAADYEVVSVGANYTDGPMAISLSHMMAEADDDSEANATMLSFSYTLARTFGANHLT